MAKKKTKVATITVLQIQHKRTNFSTYIPKEDFEAHSDEYRQNWHVVNETVAVDPSKPAAAEPAEKPAQEDAPVDAGETDAEAADAEAADAED